MYGCHTDEAADYISYLFDRHGIDIHEPSMIELLDELVEYYFQGKRDRINRDEHDALDKLKHLARDGPGYHSNYHCGPDGCKLIDHSNHHPPHHPGIPPHAARPGYQSNYHCDHRGCRPIERETRTDGNDDNDDKHDDNDKDVHDARHKRRGYSRHHRSYGHHGSYGHHARRGANSNGGRYGNFHRNFGGWVNGWAKQNVTTKAPQPSQVTTPPPSIDTPSPTAFPTDDEISTTIPDGNPN